MRILHISDHYQPVLGGIERHVSSLAARQAARGDQVTVLTTTPATADGRHWDDHGAVTVRRVRSVVDASPFDWSAYDVVHAHVSVLAPFTARMAALAAHRGVPTVVTAHSMWNGLGPVAALAASIAGLRSAPVQWTAVSREAADQLARRLPAPHGVLVLPNAVDVPPRPAPGDRPDTDPVRLVSTMRIARRKRPMALLTVFEELRRATSVPVHLTIVGDGPLRPRLERRIRWHDLDGSITVTGRVEADEVLGRLVESDVYVAPAVLESFGLAALEARCVGLPVVGRAASGLSEFVRDGREGWLVRSDADMVARLRTLVEDPLLRRRVSEHNRTHPSPLTWASALEDHDRVYARAAAAAGALPRRRAVRR
jgi:glycosyltransferase involved in cell wall biosynthesis